MSQVENLSIKHQCGKNNFKVTENFYKENKIHEKKLEIIDYIDNIHHFYEWADIIICRAGALTVSEISASGSLGIFIPLPWAIDNHQFFNAKHLSDLNAGFLIEEDENLEKSLIKVLNEIKEENKEKLEKMKENSFNAAIKHPEEIILEEIMRL